MWSWNDRLTLFLARCLLCGAPARSAVPNLCAGCALALPRLEIACRRCAAPLPVPGTCGGCLDRPPPFDRVHCPLLYDADVAWLVHALKFRNLLAPAATLAHLMTTSASSAPRPDLVLAVPLHPARLRARGYNQAAELGRRLARRLGTRLTSGIVHRKRDTEPQSALTSAKRRRANVRRAFELTGDAGIVAGARIALVDDVLTTGATAGAVAALLRRAGATSVDVWCAARVAPPGSGVEIGH